MTTKNTLADLTPDVAGSNRLRVARTTGLLYLAFFTTGILGSVLIRDELFAPSDPTRTLSNLLDHGSMARVGIVLELSIVLTQALTAVWFYRLFRRVDAVAAGSLTVFGMAGAVAIMGSAALIASAVEVANDATLAVPAGAAATVQLLYVISGNFWGVGAIFFGLWLIPMGRLVIRSRWLPLPLGWTLIVGGVLYTISAFVVHLFPDGNIAQWLLIPATIGEIWIMAYLIIVGVRD